MTDNLHSSFEPMEPPRLGLADVRRRAAARVIKRRAAELAVSIVTVLAVGLGVGSSVFYAQGASITEPGDGSAGGLSRWTTDGPLLSFAGVALLLLAVAGVFVYTLVRKPDRLRWPLIARIAGLLGIALGLVGLILFALASLGA